ncbi:CRTAC1 family protein [Marinicella sediminis]|uniref:CRTAC1 family protein n=1 Tax=Marinicella sediminis TaxID=1792834 RepID=A0ABV7J7U7_9GAMM|nr:CRTAC1 family protein [Marinicella sediminis]
MLKLIFALMMFSLTSAAGQDHFLHVDFSPLINADHSLSNGELGMGQAWTDINGDGYLDLYLTNQNGANHILLNDQSGGFVIDSQYVAGELPNSHDFGVAVTDYNNDGFQDLFISSFGPNKLLKNIGGQSFEEVSTALGLTDSSYSIASSWADINNDGWLDVYVVNYSVENDLNEADQLLLNNQGMGFIDVTADLSPAINLVKHGLAVQFIDFDADGDMDLYVVNDKQEGNTLWRNDGPAVNGCGTYVCMVDVSNATQTFRPVDGMGIAIADYDLDGDFDFYFSSIAEQVLLQSQFSQGNPWYTDQSNAVGLNFDATGWATLFMDVDNDRYPDAYLATANVTPSKRDRLYISNQMGQFNDATVFSGIEDLYMTVGAAKGDYDNDGKVDLVVGNWGTNYMLYRNINPSNHNWVKFNLTGGGDINSLAIGSRISVITSSQHTLIDQVVSGGSHGAGNSLLPHFGLGAATIDRVEVIWPNGIRSQLWAPAVNTTHILAYPGELVFATGFD